MQLKIKKANLSQWFANIAKEYEPIAPVKENVIQFKLVNSELLTLNFRLSTLNSVVLPKHFFLPQNENLFVFRHHPVVMTTPKGRCGFPAQHLKLKQSEALKKERVIYGIRPCDVKSLQFLDCVFNNEFKDPHYLERRAKTILIGLACTPPSNKISSDLSEVGVVPIYRDNTCFCNSFGIDPFSAEGTDIFLTESDEHYLVDVSTVRGKKLVNLAPDLFSTASEGDRKQSLKLKIKTVPIDRAYKCIESLWDDEIWTDISQICIECGICTYLCPTCYCFDIQDEKWDREGIRFRCWDSCMFSDFTLMASGENPRRTKRERIRNRFFHKFKYSKDRYGIFGCVGCGRCITKCPANIDITRVVEKLANYGK